MLRAYKIFLAGLGCFIAAVSFNQTYWQIHSFEKSSPQLHHLAKQFKPFLPLLIKVRAAGYYTDKNIEHPLALAQFQQAQYALAPTVLNLNQTHYPWVIFDGTTAEATIAAMKELQFNPIAVGPSGIILGLNATHSPPP